VAGIVQNVNCKSGDNVKTGQTLLQLNADSDIAQLQTLSAAAICLKVSYERNKKQFIAQAVSKACAGRGCRRFESQTGSSGPTGSSFKKKTIVRFCRTVGYIFGESRTISESGR